MEILHILFKVKRGNQAPELRNPENLIYTGPLVPSEEIPLLTMGWKNVSIHICWITIIQCCQFSNISDEIENPHTWFYIGFTYEQFFIQAHFGNIIVKIGTSIYLHIVHREENNLQFVVANWKNRVKGCFFHLCKRKLDEDKTCFSWGP